MQKIPKIILGGIIIILFIYTVYVTTPCAHIGCDNRREKGSRYCSVHKCKWNECKVEAEIGGRYCSFHRKEDEKNNKKTLTTAQSEKIKELIEDYCDELVEKQSDVISISVTYDNPLVFDDSAAYRCKVERISLGTSDATIYVNINGKDNFSIDCLLYKKQ